MLENELLPRYVFKEKKLLYEGFDLEKEYQELKESLLFDPSSIQEKLSAFAAKANDAHFYFTFKEEKKSCPCCSNQDAPSYLHIEGRAATFRIGNFSECYHPREVEKIIQRAEEEADSLTLDLTATSGGSLLNCDHLASLFLKTPIRYSFTSGESVEIRPHSSTHFTKPLTVLIDRCTFSAAELFAAIIQDSVRGEILGEKSAGSGGVTETLYFPFNDFGLLELHFPSRSLLRPSGNEIEGCGIEAG